MQSSLLSNTLNVFTQQSRNTFIFKRKYPVPLYKKNQRPKPLKSRHMIYEMLESPYSKKRKYVLVKLKQDIVGVGAKGTIIELHPDKAYERFLLPKLADYVSPEEEEEFRNRPKEHFDQTSVSNVIDLLSSTDLSITMSPTEPWTIEKWHVSVSFRKCGIFVPEDAITLPEKPISGPNKEAENKVFIINVEVNENTNVKVKCRIHHVHIADLIKNKLEYKKQTPEWLHKNEALFPEDQELIDQLPMHLLLRKNTNTFKTS